MTVMAKHPGTPTPPYYLSLCRFFHHGRENRWQSFLLAYLTSLEVGPRVGNALYGADILTMGWHSGALFGPSASTVAVSKLLSLPAS
jgi:hypothetical protein